MSDYRTWMADVVEGVEDEQNDAEYGYEPPIWRWGADLDEAIATEAAAATHMSAVVNLVDLAGVIAIPAYSTERKPHPLLALSHHGGDEDWIIAAQRLFNGYDGQLLAEKLTVCSFERHDTPTFSIYITAHS